MIAQQTSTPQLINDMTIVYTPVSPRLVGLYSPTGSLAEPERERPPSPSRRDLQAQDPPSSLTSSLNQSSSNYTLRSVARAYLHRLLFSLFELLAILWRPSVLSSLAPRQHSSICPRLTPLSMITRWTALAALGILGSIWPSHAYQNCSRADLLQSSFSLNDDRPPDCTPCINCNLEAFQCAQFSSCNKYNGKCSCPPGFGGEDCSKPLCGSLAKGKDRAPRGEGKCICEDGWEGINCNVCKTNDACNSLMPENSGGVCYKDGVVVKENHQMCDITNRKILDQLKERTPQATFSCNAEEDTCNFQFWVGQEESFYCALDTCSYSSENDYDKNTTSYKCEHIRCACVPGRMLCGEEGSIDIGEFLDKSIKGPAAF